MLKKHPFCLIRVVDDDASVRDSYRYLIESEGWIVRTYQDAEDFIENDDKTVPGCVILDIRMPGLSGLELQVYLEKIICPLPIIFVSAHADVEIVVRAIRHGALNFLTKPVDDEKLLSSIEEAVDKFFENQKDNEATDKVIRLWKTLSPREQEVAVSVAKGTLNKIIADDLGISERTVQVHRAKACLKLGVKNAVELSKVLEVLPKTLLPEGRHA